MILMFQSLDIKDVSTVVHISFGTFLSQEPSLG